MVDARVSSVAWVADLVDAVLNNTSRPAILIVCSTRAKFLEQLSAGLSARARDAQTEASSGGEVQVNNQHLLTKTIGVLANSRRVHLVFCPSLGHFRAYLSSLRLSRATDQNVAACGTTNIVVLDLIALHYMSSEFSAQGLSRTLALTIEATARNASSILLCECNDAVVLQNPNRGHRIWDLHLPILSGSSRPEDGGRQLSARHVAQRWFRFEADIATMSV
ncbi:uncharacterized protein TRUGW13939_05596 [Talaromyces rugulosus]|uniref:DNA recombination and repair protein Rad51-like C-terminal domain-containing protein n=1 Tax=Talaromyces rugulosus TaxID=121627 RepID=A0A7H8QWJ4_TALRU|nr:uncharacterized protein TRUGW13939_05596 [Talaromyces rugulosus]QKX58472.1 hypothetical protein TRUGW13939_05596 [Talaromyces rugulosus]